MTQREFISQFISRNKGAIIVGSLGTISKDLIELDNKKNRIIPIKGAMGCAVGVGLGIALNSDKQVYVLIGDGALLMKLGSLATVAKCNPINLKIIVLDNGCHASCGGQPTNFRYMKKYIEKIPFVEINEIHS